MVDFETNKGLVSHTYRKHFVKYTWLKEDLMQEGYLALWRACMGFDESLGNKFSSYAIQSIKRGMLRLVLEEEKHASATELFEDSEMEAISPIETEEERVCNDVVYNDLKKKILDACDFPETLELYIDDNTQVRIAKRFGITRQGVSKRIGHDKKRIDKLLFFDKS